MRSILLGTLLFLTQLLFSQVAKTSLLIDRFTHEGKGDYRAVLPVCEAEVASAFIGHGAFSVVDRKSTQKIEQELERQKSEQFIDGKVVEQGVAVGAEYIVVGNYDFTTWLLELKLVSVSNQMAVEKEVRKVDMTAPVNYYKKQIKDIVNKLANKIVMVEKAVVVRVLESKKGDAQLILIAGGSSKGFKEGQLLEIFAVEMEQVGEESFERFAPIGEAKIDKVENANFSQAKVKKGGSDILRLLDEKKTIYCRIMN